MLRAAKSGGWPQENISAAKLCDLTYRS